MIKLTKIQKEMFYYMQDVKHPALFCTMRSRKTIVVLKDLLFQENFPVLICTPLNALHGWSSDLEKLGVTKNEVQLLVGTKKKKEKLFDANKKFTLTNKEFYRSMPNLTKELKPQSIVLDEAHCVKDPKTAMTKFYMNNLEFKKANRRYILTGTPMHNSLLDIYCQLQFLDPTIFNCNSYWVFRKKFFYNSWTPNKNYN